MHIKLLNFLINNVAFTIILSLGILLRILWIINVPTIPVSDFKLYYEGAASIVNGTGYLIYGYPSAYEPIGYPMFLAMLFKIFGVNVLIGKIANLFLASISLMLMYLIAKISFKKDLPALISMLLLAILPLHIMYTSVLSTEIIFTAFLLAIAYLIMLSKNKMWKYIVLGILLGLSSLIKPYMMVFQFAIFTLELIEIKDVKRCLTHFLLITVFMVITISPWTIRNYVVFHKLIPISTNGGYNLYVNNNPYANGSWQDPFKIPDSPLLSYKHTSDDFWDEVKVDEAGKKYAFNWIVHNPVSFAKVGLEKLNNVFIKYDDGYWSTMKLESNKVLSSAAMLSQINKVIHLVTMLFVFTFIILLIFNLIVHKTLDHLTLVLLMNLSFYILITFLFEGQPRYLFPLWPLFILCICHSFMYIKKGLPCK